MKRLLWAIRLRLAEIHDDLYLRPSLDVFKVKWTAQDEDSLRGFLTSETGEKLQAVCLAHVQNTDHQAVAISTPRACGYATGMRSMLASFIALSGHVPPQADDSKTEELQGLPRLRNPFPEPGDEKPANS